MSTAPQTLIDLRRFLADEYGVERKNFGIAGRISPRRPWGYHLGEGDIYGPDGMGDDDYSVQRKRDKRGLTNASAGFDIRLPQGKLRELVAYLVNKCRMGETKLLVEVIGPNAQGEAKRWAKGTNWQPVDARDDHEWHAHLSFFRDTEEIDKRPLFYELVDYQPPQPDETGDPLDPPPGEPPVPDSPPMPEDPPDPCAELRERIEAAREALA